MTITAIANLKGGVGKTTIANGLVHAAAASGKSCLLVDADMQGNSTKHLTGYSAANPAPNSLADVLDAPVEGRPTKVAKRLHAQQVQAQDEMEQHWSAVSDWLGTLLMERGTDRIAAEELTVPPGGVAHARYLVKRVRLAHPSARIVVGHWGKYGTRDEVRPPLLSAGADEVAMSLIEARDHLLGWLPVLESAEAVPQARSA